jgi:transcription initiation factor TFIIF subunit beta
MRLERTTLAGRIKHEVNCVAVENQETKYLLQQMTQEAMRPKHVTKFVSDPDATTSNAYIQPGTIGASNAFSSFIVRIIRMSLFSS